eukprot:965578-Rhodomonas_salina.2
MATKNEQRKGGEATHIAVEEKAALEAMLRRLLGITVLRHRARAAVRSFGDDNVGGQDGFEADVHQQLPLRIGGDRPVQQFSIHPRPLPRVAEGVQVDGEVDHAVCCHAACLRLVGIQVIVQGSVSFHRAPDHDRKSVWSRIACRTAA